MARAADVRPQGGPLEVDPAERDGGPSDDQEAEILGADVKRYTISAVGDP